ncbi:MAG: creatininase family protein [Thermomicrobiales bacterium]|nr:creatininase family protein [Thermomicrobiales bacterium]MCO5222914.1 creatininase family protein [Thermomicrobiales bacterium]
MSVRRPYMYSDLTWPEIRDAIERQPVVILPVGTVEQHGHHLPLDTDNFLIGSVTEEVGRRAPDDALVMPVVPYGFNWHHIDFPGTIGIDVANLINYLGDITRSLAYHGFERILLVSGHGSNTALLDLVARKTVIETGALCASFMYLNIVRGEVNEIVESPISHACEWETSLYLHFDRDRVQMDSAVRDYNIPESQFFRRAVNSPVAMMEWWSSFSDTGVVGDASLATLEKGSDIFDVTIDRFVELVREFRRREKRPRRDHHRPPFFGPEDEGAQR